MPMIERPMTATHAAGASVWAIGVFHGQAQLLDRLLAALPRQERDITVFLGDFLDRGPDSRKVVETVLAEYDRAPDRTVLLWGNHEMTAAAHFRQPNPLGWTATEPIRMAQGFLPTLESFGLPPSVDALAHCPETLARLFGILQPFWRCTLPGLEHVIFVHAGVPPGRKPEDCPE